MRMCDWVGESRRGGGRGGQMDVSGCEWMADTHVCARQLLSRGPDDRPEGLLGGLRPEGLWSPRRVPSPTRPNGPRWQGRRGTGGNAPHILLRISPPPRISPTGSCTPQVGIVL